MWSGTFEPGLRHVSAEFVTGHFPLVILYDASSGKAGQAIFSRMFQVLKKKKEKIEISIK